MGPFAAQRIAHGLMDLSGIPQLLHVGGSRLVRHAPQLHDRQAGDTYGISEKECGDGCIPLGGRCCDNNGNWCAISTVCGNGGCCPVGETCTGVPDGCSDSLEECGNGCMPAGASCCSGYYCDAGETCMGDGLCSVGDDIDGDDGSGGDDGSVGDGGGVDGGDGGDVDGGNGSDVEGGGGTDEIDDGVNGGRTPVLDAAWLAVSLFVFL
ncbi:uncharacterized protein J7T54_005267 [Emericellopsis cladophorae]|uniref:Uncharacterized protein n=1 Tax=Emericellopsis cladophorae TaxID=2686198 RepID=A0A9P9Y151_9HYPO|nr:uncharacterized protein J7T54_005267 [Emericellopsis cladophorae]KAI6781556.1 hypothetical protein J7T54_005267 [Emericellopsis cladophorae]